MGRQKRHAPGVLFRYEEFLPSREPILLSIGHSLSGRATPRSACTLCRERAGCSWTEYNWDNLWAHFRLSLTCRAVVPDRMRHSERRFSCAGFSGAKLQPVNEIVNLSEHAQ